NVTQVGPSGTANVGKCLTRGPALSGRRGESPRDAWDTTTLVATKRHRQIRNVSRLEGGLETVKASNNMHRHGEREGEPWPARRKGKHLPGGDSTRRSARR